MDKHYGVKRLLKEFPNKGCLKGRLGHLLRKIDKTGDFAQISRSGRTPIIFISEHIFPNKNVEEIEELLLS